MVWDGIAGYGYREAPRYGYEYGNVVGQGAKNRDGWEMETYSSASKHAACEACRGMRAWSLENPIKPKLSIYFTPRNHNNHHKDRGGGQRAGTGLDWIVQRIGDWRQRLNYDCGSYLRTVWQALGSVGTRWGQWVMHMGKDWTEFTSTGVFKIRY